VSSAGDEVSTGDLLFDIETDKATMAVESTEDGFLATVLIEGGSNVRMPLSLSCVPPSPSVAAPSDISRLGGN
jgi:pyruvate carboxylase